MPTEAQMQTYIDALGITRMEISTRNYDDEFTTLLYQILTDGKDNIVCHNDAVVCHNDAVVYLSV